MLKNFVILMFLVVLSSSLSAAPQFVSLAERCHNADNILIVQVDDVKTAPFNDISKSAQLRLNTIEVLKGDNPGIFQLAFLVFPQTYENHLREPVPEGKYIVFLKKKKVGRDQSAFSYVLLEPRHFAFVDYENSALKEIKKLLKK